MEQIKIGTCIPGQQAEQWLPGMKDKGFECFAINFHMTYSGIDLKELAPKVMGMLEGTGTYVSTVGYYCNALQNESQLHDLEYAIDNAHLFGAKTVATFAGALEGQSVDAAMPRFKEVFSELAKRAEDRGVKLAIENCPMGGDWRHATCNIGINPDAWELMFDAVPSDALGLEWEPAHQLIQLIDPIAQLRRMGQEDRPSPRQGHLCGLGCGAATTASSPPRISPPSAHPASATPTGGTFSPFCMRTATRATSASKATTIRYTPASGK